MESIEAGLPEAFALDGEQPWTCEEDSAVDAIGFASPAEAPLSALSNGRAAREIAELRARLAQLEQKLEQRGPSAD